ncbi:hypothetical protein [Rhizobium sp.]
MIAGEAVVLPQALLAGGALEIKPYASVVAALIATELSSLKPSVMGKTRIVLEARLAFSGSRFLAERRVRDHAEAAARATRRLPAITG